MAKFSANATAITSPIANDSIMMVRGSTSTNKLWTIAGFITYVSNLITGTWTTETILDTATGSIGLGAHATYQGFDVKAIIGCGTDRFIVIMRFVYDNSTNKHYFISGNGTLTSGINIKGSSF